MKKIIHRDVFRSSPRKREVSVDETINRNGTMVRKKKSCKYFIRDAKKFDNLNDLENWIDQQKIQGLSKSSHVFRELNTDNGTNKVICKVMGEFFAIRKMTAFRILYVNEIKVELDTNMVRSE
jgi:hypothetical protein